MSSHSNSAVTSADRAKVRRRALRGSVSLLLMTGAAIPARADAAANDAGTSAEASGAQAATAAQGATPAQLPPEQQEIVVTGQALFPGVQPERNLDEQAIESYDASTVDDLLNEIEAELGGADEDQPLILLNGKRISDPDEIAGLPVEVLRNVQVLPRGTAVRLGGTAGQRVISLTLHHQVRSATVTVAPKIATEGEWHALRGEAILTKIHGDARANLALHVRDEGSLFESDRGIIQPVPVPAFAIGGNVVGYPDSTAEIDPLLSSLGGKTITVAPMPSIADPTLADFVAGANKPTVTDIGGVRTLRPKTRNYDLSGSFSTRLAPWLTSTIALKLDQTTSRSIHGLPGALFLLPSTNPYSPFSTDVGIAVYGQQPLRSRSRFTTGGANITFNAQFGQWTADLNTRHSESQTSYASDQVTTFGAIPLDDSTNPFATNLSDLIPLSAFRSTTRSASTLTQLLLSGPAVTLPAGPVQATIEGRLAWDSLHTHGSFSPIPQVNHFRRSEQTIRGAVDVPLTSRANDFLAAVGDIDATAEYSRTHFSDAGTVDHYIFGLTWEPAPLLRLHASIEQNVLPPSVQLLGDAVIVTPGVRVFDPLTGETVDVSTITGGNPSLRPETDRVRSASALLRLLPKWNLQLNAEYTDTDRRNSVSGLPEASAAVMLAFPDRFVRDPDGQLTTIDFRPVNFESARDKSLRWGLSMNRRLWGGPPARDAQSQGHVVAGPGAPTPSTYFQLTVNHTIVFSDEIRIRPGLDPVDLLGGGAIGFGASRPRHQVDGTAALTSGGLGARVGFTWRGKSTLVSQFDGVTDTLTFSPILALNLRLFADGRRLLPHSNWAKGLRVSLNVLNATDYRQRVTDSFGSTPLEYQPAYRDALGRTIELEIRKVF